MEIQHNRDLTNGYLRLDIEDNDPVKASVTTPIFTDFDSPESVRIIGNRYLIVNYVGSGTRGEIYEAIDQQISKATSREQRVSIEVLSLRENQTHLVSQFAGKFAELVNIPHLSIARSIDFGVDDQSVFFKMELLEGTSLRSILDGSSTEAFTENEVLSVLRSAADALTHMHDHGFTHGNLTPDSIFVTNDFEVKIIDFASEVLRQSFDILANRQTGVSNHLQPVEDVYGLGAIVYEMLAGEPAYDGASRTQARRKGSKLRPIARLSRHRRKALTRALALRFDKRTPTVAEFVEEFGVAGDEILDIPTDKKKSNVNRILMPLTAVLAVAAIAAFLQPSFDVIVEKLSGWKDSVVAQVSPEPVTAEQSTVVAAPIAEPAAEEIAVTEVTAVEPTLATQVVQSLESEMAEYVAQNEAIDQATSIETDSVVEQSEAISDDQSLSADTLDSFLESESLQVATESLPVSTALFTVDSDVESLSAINAVSVTTAEVAANEVAFDRQSLTVNESQSMAAILIRRSGNTSGSESVIWWTAENTAKTDMDYAELGVRTEVFTPGQKSMTVYVPIVSDSVREGTESFYVYAQSFLSPKDEIHALEVFVADDDG